MISAFERQRQENQKFKAILSLKVVHEALSQQAASKQRCVSRFPKCEKVLSYTTKGKAEVAKRLVSWFLSRKVFRAQYNHRILASRRGMQKRASENGGGIRSRAGERRE